MRSAKKTVKSKASAAKTSVGPAKQTQILRKAATKARDGAVKAMAETPVAARKRPAEKRAAEKRKAAASRPNLKAERKEAPKSSARQPPARKAPAAGKSSSKTIKSPAAAKAPAKAKVAERSKVLNTGAKAGRITAANAGRLERTAKGKPLAKAQTIKSAVRAAGAARIQSVAKKIKPVEISGAGASSAGRSKTAAAPRSASPPKPAAGKRSAGIVVARAETAPDVINLREASKRQAIGRAFIAGRTAGAANRVPSEDEQKRVTKKIEKKTAVESPAIVARVSDPAVVHSIAAAPPMAAVVPATPGAERTSGDVKGNDRSPASIGKAAKAPSTPRQGFKPNDFIVYPAHGVGQIVAIEEQEVAGFKLELYVIIFVKDKMILKVPTPKVVSVGMRKLAEADIVQKALNTLTGRARIKRTMWSRRAQEYEAKINSGDLISIAEVVRDLYRSDAQPEQSYSERQLYEAALDRMAREVVIVQKLTETETLRAIEAQLQKGPRRGKAEEIEADEAEPEIEEAA